MVLVEAPASDKCEALPWMMPQSNPSVSTRKYGLLESRDVEILKVQLQDFYHGQLINAFFFTLQPKSKWFLRNVHQKGDSLDSRLLT